MFKYIIPQESIMSIEKMQKLRSQGKTYQQIADELGCCKSTICYHLGLGQKQKAYQRLLKRHPMVKKIEFFSSVKPFKQKPKTTNSTKQLLKSKIYTFFKGTEMSKTEYNTPTFTVNDVFKKFGETPKCYLTGDDIDLNRPRTYQFDHIIPRSRGGSNDIDNLGICTKQANHSKSDMMMDEYLNHCKKVLLHHGQI